MRRLKLVDMIPLDAPSECPYNCVGCEHLKGVVYYIKPQVCREYFERMSETQVRGLPFIGSLQPWKIAPKKEEVKDENNW